MDMPDGLVKSIGNEKAVPRKNERGGWFFESE